MRQIGADGFTGKVEFVIFNKNRGFCYDGENVCDDEELTDEEIDSLAAWCKKCELMIRKNMIQKAGEEYVLEMV